jgi:hypothetical protein
MTGADEKNEKKMEPSYQREEQVKKGTGVYNEIN